MKKGKKNAFTHNIRQSDLISLRHGLEDKNDFNQAMKKFKNSLESLNLHF